MFSAVGKKAAFYSPIFLSAAGSKELTASEVN
ncbi:MAG: hypothetical protein JWQ40_4295 [Segetibacter sp.]|nr:hypothetical protein [Segetibacter sp.]